MTRDWPSDSFVFRSGIVFVACIRYLVSGVILFSSSILHAGNSEGLVTTPLVNEANVFMFSAGSHVNKPACATQSLGTWAVSLNNPAGQNMMTLVLSAHAQGKKVNVVGAKNCSDWGDREKPLWLFIVD